MQAANTPSSEVPTQLGDEAEAGAKRKQRVRFLALAFMILAAGLGLRFWDIGRLEPFVDEGGYVLASVDANFRQTLHPMAEGKPIIGWVFRHAALLPFDPLVTARCTVALLGTVTALALGYILLLSVGTQAALIGMALWAFSPLVVFHERLALFDPVIASLLALALAAITAAARGICSKTKGLFLSALGGCLFGIACLVKVSALLALPWFGLVVIALLKRFQKPLFTRHTLLIFAGVCAPFALLGPELWKMSHSLNQLDLLAVNPSNSGSGFALGTILHDSLMRLPVILNGYAGYGRWPLALLILASLYLFQRKASLSLWILGVAWLVTLPVAAICYNNPQPRYLIPDLLPLFLLLAACLGGRWHGTTTGLSFGRRSQRPEAGSQIEPMTAGDGERRAEQGGAELSKDREAVYSPGWETVVLVCILVSVGGWLLADLAIVREPRTAPIPTGEIEQYMTGRWSSEGLGKTIRYLENHSQQTHRSCLVFVHRYSRPGSYGLILAARKRPWLTVVPLTLDSPLSLGAADAVVGKSASIIGQSCDVFILAEGPDLLEPKLLRNAGAKFEPAFEYLRGDGISRFALLRYYGGKL